MRIYRNSLYKFPFFSKQRTIISVRDYSSKSRSSEFNLEESENKLINWLNYECHERKLCNYEKKKLEIAQRYQHLPLIIDDYQKQHINQKQNKIDALVNFWSSPDKLKIIVAQSPKPFAYFILFLAVIVGLWWSGLQAFKYYKDNKETVDEYHQLLAASINLLKQIIKEWYNKYSIKINITHSGKIKQIVMLPEYHSDEFYVIDLEKLDILNKILTDKKGEQYEVAIIGMGGIGKTVLAMQYAKLFNNQNKDASIIMLQAHDVKYLALQYLDIARKLNLAIDKNINEEAIIKTPKEQAALLIKIIEPELAKLKDYLIIYDDVDNYSEILKLTPSLDKGKILITSRHAPPKEMNITSIQLSGLSLQASTKLLDEKLKNIPATDKEKLKLIQLLDYNPLALAMAIAYMSHENIDIKAYIKVFSEKMENMETDNIESRPKPM